MGRAGSGKLSHVVESVQLRLGRRDLRQRAESPLGDRGGFLVGKREDELPDLGREVQQVECLGDASPGNAKVSGSVHSMHPRS